MNDKSWSRSNAWNVSVTAQLSRLMPTYDWKLDTCELTRRICWDQHMSPLSTALVIIDSDEFAELD